VSGTTVAPRQRDATAARLASRLRPPVSSRRRRVAYGVANVIAFFVLWEVFVRVTGVPSLLMPAFSSVVAALPEMLEEGILIPNVIISLRNYFVGMVLSIAVAVPLGFVIGGVKVLDRLLGPYVWTLYTLPRIILMPLILAWFGLGTTARILLILVSAVPAIMVFVMEGAKNTDTSLVRAARSFGASRARVFTAVALPSTVPFVATGIRMGISRGLVGLFIGELFTGADGIGFLQLEASRRSDTARVFLILFLFVAFSLGVVGLSNALERRASRWRAL
jgi:ABC-type nitrate/sulfonate/bicarbonate transport system permease component